jgi:hypothetical protein
MKEEVNQWFEQSAPFQGILACGVRHIDRSAMCKTWADGFAEAGIENALRCASDLYQVMQVNRVPMGLVRWVYQEALFHCERRPDGVCLGVFTPRDSSAVDFAGLDRFFSEFRAIATPANT